MNVFPPKHAILALGLAGLGAVLASGAAAMQQPAPSAAEDSAAITLFRTTGCAYCHGADAQGTAKAPSLQTCGRRLSREEIARQIRDGGRAMPAFAEVLDPAGLDRLTLWLSHQKASERTAPR